MWTKLKLAVLTRLRLKESWVIFFVAGIIAMNYPYITIFNKPTTVFEIPLLFLYLNIGWLISIFVIYLYIKAIDLPKKDENRREHR